MKLSTFFENLVIIWVPLKDYVSNFVPCIITYICNIDLDILYFETNLLKNSASAHVQIHKFKDKSAKFSCPVIFCGFRNVMNFKLWQISPLDNFSWFVTPYAHFPLSLNDFWNAKCVHDQIHDSINRLLLPRCDSSENFKLMPSFHLLEFITKTSKPFPLELMLSFLVFERQELIFFFCCCCCCQKHDYLRSESSMLLKFDTNIILSIWEKTWKINKTILLEWISFSGF